MLYFSVSPMVGNASAWIPEVLKSLTAAPVTDRSPTATVIIPARLTRPVQLRRTTASRHSVLIGAKNERVRGRRSSRAVLGDNEQVVLRRTGGEVQRKPSQANPTLQRRRRGVMLWFAAVLVLGLRWEREQLRQRGRMHPALRTSADGPAEVRKGELGAVDGVCLLLHLRLRICESERAVEGVRSTVGGS